MIDIVDKVIALMKVAPHMGNDRMAAEVIIDAIRRDTGLRGGRPKKDPEKPLTNHLQTTSEPPTNHLGGFSQLPASSDLEQEKDQDLGTDSSELPAEPSKPEADPPADTVLTFQTAGKVKRWHLSRRFVEDCREGYVGLDVEGEFRKARVWVEANPGKRKTAKGMPAFLANWLARAQNRGGGGANGTGPPRGLHVGHVRITGNEDYGPEGEQQL